MTLAALFIAAYVWRVSAERRRLDDAYAASQAALARAQRLSALRKPVWLRYVLVTNLTDEPRDIRHLARFAGRLGNVERVDVLPFHQLGRFKWQALGLDYKLAKTKPPDHSALLNAKAIFRAEGLNTP